MIIKTEQQLKEVINLEKELDKKFSHRQHSKEQTFLKSLRILEYCYNTNFGLLSKILWGGARYYRALFVYKFLSFLRNVSIPCNVFDKGLIIWHLQNIVISSEAKVGAYCLLLHNTTIGASFDANDHGKCPCIGDYVALFEGCGVLGPINIENNTSIAAGAIVTKSFTENNITIGGIPACKISDRTIWSAERVDNILKN